VATVEKVGTFVSKTATLKIAGETQGIERENTHTSSNEKKFKIENKPSHCLSCNQSLLLKSFSFVVLSTMCNNKENFLHFVLQ